MWFRNRYEITLFGVGLLGSLWLGFSQAAELLPRSETQVGTLFYSATERRHIDQARSGDPTDAAPALVYVNGIVKRRGGLGSAWINGQPVAENQPVPAINGAATISGAGIMVNGQPLRVGETLNLTTQQRSDVVAPGTVIHQDTR